jgi:hypothetical protein
VVLNEMSNVLISHVDGASAGKVEQHLVVRKGLSWMSCKICCCYISLGICSRRETTSDHLRWCCSLDPDVPCGCVRGLLDSRLVNVRVCL